MHAFLIVTKEKKLQETETNNLVNKLQAKSIKFSATKIEDVKSIGRYTKLKLTHRQAVILDNIDSASIAAINALLKTLEEPQKNLYFILTSSNYYDVPETIRSRCQINKIGKINQHEESDVDFVHAFLNKSTSEKFASIDKIKDRENALNFITLVIEVTHNDLIKSERPDVFITILENSQACLDNLRANGNIALQLTTFVVGIDSLK